MANLLKALSALLAYPTKELQGAAPAIEEAIACDPGASPGARSRLHGLMEEIAVGDLYDLQERYVLLFDRTRSLSLHLFEHVYGESRDRGQAMVDLRNLYEKNGLVISTSELPDHVPLFLEFLSTRPREEACDLLGQTAHILSALGERLRKRHSPYAAIFEALVEIAGKAPEADATSELVAEPTRTRQTLLPRCRLGRGAGHRPGGRPRLQGPTGRRMRAARRPAAGAQ